MLFSLVLLLATLLSWLTSGAEPIAGALGKPAITPQDPSTLTLALIGAAVLGVYFAISRRPGRRRKAGPWTGRLSDQSVQGMRAIPSATEEDLPSRGAA
jgi:hypothetical protein